MLESWGTNKPINRISRSQLSSCICLPRPVVSSESHRRPIILCYFLATCSVCVWVGVPHLTCQAFGTGSGWRTEAAARLCYQAPASIAACSDAQLPQNPLTDTPGAPARPTLGRKAYVLSVLEHQHSPKRGGNNTLEVMEEIKADTWKQKINKIKRWGLRW